MNEERKAYWLAECKVMQAILENTLEQLESLRSEGFTEQGPGNIVIGLLITAARYLADNLTAFANEHLKPKA